jgi:hypothetical protein
MEKARPLVANYLRNSAERSRIAHSPEDKATMEEGIMQREEMAQERFAHDDIEGVLCLISSGARLDFICDNAQLLKERGLFERGLLDAWTGANTNIRYWSLSFTEYIFGSFSDRGRLLAAGQPLPGEGPFTLYRGVAGHGAARRIRGISWTASVERAGWFATVFYAERFHLPNPCIYRTTVEKEHVLAYSNDRQEEEFLVLLPQRHKVELFKRLVDG